MAFCPTGGVGRYFLKTSLPHQSFTAFEPDVLLSGDEAFDIRNFGVAGMVRHTPGHTAGSLSVELDNHEAMVGDLVASGILIGGILRINHAIQPPFEDDTFAVLEELMRLVDSGVERFYLGHGGPLQAKEVRRHAEALASKWPSNIKEQKKGN